MLVAIGDVHGYYHEMQLLLANLRSAGVDFGRDRLIWLGDYIDGGPDSDRVVRAVIELQQLYPHWTFLKGNHEAELITAAKNPHDRAQVDNWFRQGGRETLLSYCRGRPGPVADEDLYDAGRIVPEAHLRWLDELAPWTETDSFTFVHAGFDPNLPTFADNSPDITLWIRDEFIRSERDWGKRIIYGHTNVPEPLVMPNKIGINTLHRDGGYLTAVLIADDEPAAFRFIRN